MHIAAKLAKRKMFNQTTVLYALFADPSRLQRMAALACDFSVAEFMSMWS